MLSGNNIRRNILAEAATSLYHYISTDMAELMAKHLGTQDSIIVYHHFTGYLGRVADDDIATNHTVMGDMHILHEQVIIAHDGSTL